MATKELRAKRRAFVEEQRAIAEVEGRSFPPRAMFDRVRKNSVYKAWACKAGRWRWRDPLPAAEEWTDRADQLGFERFLAHVGAPPDGSELQVIDPSQPFGPGNARWGNTIADARGGPAWHWAADEELAQERAEYVARLVAQDATGELAEYRNIGLFVRNADANYLYSAWKDQVRRCHNQGTRGWKNYGGRGIRVHEDWRYDYETYAAQLLLDIGPRPSPELSLDRIDNDRGYERGNLRWATRKEQQANRRTEHDPEGDKLRVDVNEWAEWDRLGIPYDADGLPFPDDLGDSPCYCEELGV